MELMGNMISYIKWRGDLDFTERPLNELDNLVFCQLTYLDMRPAFQAQTSMTVRELVDFLLDHDGLNPMVLGDYEAVFTEFARAVADSRRFGDLTIEHYREEYDPGREREIQFAAMSFRIDRQTSFIAFRGTDASLVGWKEDFMLSFRRIDAQEAALEYLTAMLDPERRYYMGGHSKGGNLVLYAASQLPKSLQDCLVHLYINDAPGLCEDVLDTSAIALLDTISTKIVPEYDVIGKVFEMPISHSLIVQSSEKGLMQHDMLSWQIRDGHLDLAPAQAPGSIWIGTVLDNWLSNVTTQEREVLVNDLFDAIANAGVESFNELGKLGRSEFESILSGITHIDPVSLKAASSLPLVIAIGAKGAKKARSGLSRLLSLLTTNRYVQSGALGLCGIGCLLLPNHLLTLTIAIALSLWTLGIVINTVKMLKKSGWDFSAVQMQANICLLSVAVYAVLLIKESALLLTSDLIYGLVLLFLAYKASGSAGKKPKGSAIRVIRICEAVLLWFVALWNLVAPFNTMRYVTFGSGILLCVVALGRLTRELLTHYRAQKKATAQS